MKVKVKLFALLDQYLPAGARNNEIDLEVDEGATATSLIERLRVPPDMCHLVLVNGDYLQPNERGSRPLKTNDVLAIWPPIAGG